MTYLVILVVIEHEHTTTGFKPSTYFWEAVVAVRSTMASYGGIQTCDQLLSGLFLKPLIHRLPRLLLLLLITYLLHPPAPNPAKE